MATTKRLLHLLGTFGGFLVVAESWVVTSCHKRLEVTALRASSSEPLSTVQQPDTDDESVMVLPPVPLGGDFAGLSATFNTDGSLIPIPEKLIPKTLIEWGQAPTALEVLLSEDPANTKPWTRQTVTVLPETGCAVDNMDTIKTVEIYDDQCAVLVTETVLVLVSKVSDRELQVEATFGQEDFHRLRVIAPLALSEENHLQIQAPIRVILERQVDVTSTKGMIADGGGLDGQRVSRMMGQRLRQLQNFAEKPVISTSLHGAMAVFPGNVTVAYGHNDQGPFVEIAHVVTEDMRQIARVTVPDVDNPALDTYTESRKARTLL